MTEMDLVFKFYMLLTLILRELALEGVENSNNLVEVFAFIADSIADILTLLDVVFNLGEDVFKMDNGAEDSQ